MRTDTRARFLLLCLLTIGLVCAIGSGQAAAQNGTSGATPQSSGRLQASVDWLISQQTSDGGFPGFDGASDPGITVDALISLAAAQQSGVDTGTSIEDAVGYLGSGDIALVYIQTGVGQAAKLVLALVATGQDIDDFANVTPVPVIENGQDPESGLYGISLYDHALSILAIDAAGGEVPGSAVDAIVTAQSSNGGWGFEGSPDPIAADSNTTSIIIQALVAIDADVDDSVAAGLAYLETTISDEGAAAFNDAEGAVPDANSTALVAQALIAAGRDPVAQITALSGFQNESGAMFFANDDRSDNLFSTIQAIPPLAGAVLPLVPST